MTFFDEKMKLNIPDSYMSKYITTSQGEAVLKGLLRIKGSCAVFNHIKVPGGKKESISALYAHNAEKFFKEPGFCQYLFPHDTDIGLEICDSRLKPNWVYPFTGTGFLPNLVPLYYLTKELQPNDSHFLICFDDEGIERLRYAYSSATQNWQLTESVNFFNKKSYCDNMDIEKEEWEKITQQISNNSSADPAISIWGILFKLPIWYAIPRYKIEDEIVPYLGDNNGTPTVILFTSKSLALEFAQTNNLDTTSFDTPVLKYLIPKDIQELINLSKHKVKDVMFNMGVVKQGVHGHLNELTPIYDWLLKYDPRYKK